MHLLITSTSEIQLPESNRYGGTFGRAFLPTNERLGVRFSSATDSIC